MCDATWLSNGLGRKEGRKEALVCMLVAMVLYCTPRSFSRLCDANYNSLFVERYLRFSVCYAAGAERKVVRYCCLSVCCGGWCML